MTTYKWLLLFHVLFAVVWLGGSIYIEGLLANASRTGDPKDLMRTALRVFPTNKRLFGVAGVGTVVFGFWLVLETAWTFEMAWVAIALALTIVAIVIGIFYFGPRGDAIAARVAEHGLDDPEATAQLRQIGTVGHVNALLLFVTLVLMIFKPGG
jgi:uncharacterized membrane protein